MNTLELNIAQALTKAPREALAHFEALAKQQPDSLSAHLGLGAALFELGRYVEAAAAFRVAGRLAPNERAPMVLSALALEQARSYPEALEAWRTVVAVEPKARDAHERVARLADVLGKTELALEARRALAALLPGSPEVLGDLGVRLSRAGLHAEAVRTFERTRVLEPGFLESHPVERSAYQSSLAASRR